MLSIYFNHLFCLEKVSYVTVMVTLCMEAILIGSVLLDLRKNSIFNQISCRLKV